MIAVHLGFPSISF